MITIGFKPLFALALLACSFFSSAGLSAQMAQNQIPPYLPIEAFAAPPSFVEPKLSPDGKQIAYFTTIDGRRLGIIQNLDGTNRVFVPPIDQADVSRIEWASNDRLIIIYSFFIKRANYRRAMNETRMALMSRDATEIDMIFSPSRGSRSSRLKTRNEDPIPPFQDDIVSMLPDDPKHFLVSVDTDLDNSDELYLINIKSGKRKYYRRDSRGIQNWYVDHSHTVRLGTGYNPSTGKPTLILYDTKGKVAATAKTDWVNKFNIMGFTENPNEIFVDALTKAGTSGIYRLALDSGEIIGTEIERSDVDIEGVTFHPETGLPAGFVYTDDLSREEYFDTGLERIQKTIDQALPKGANTILGKAVGQENYIILHRSDTNPGSYFWYDKPAKNIALIANLNQMIDSAQMSATRQVTIPARDGTPIPAYLTIPKGRSGQNMPTVVFPHGGPFGVRSDASWDPFIQFLANRGYAVLQPNFRGSGGYGQDFKLIGYKQWGGLMQDDVADATKWLIEAGISDPERICIGGISYGGYAAAMGAVKTPDLYKCAISGNGVLDIPRMKNFDDDFIGTNTWIDRMGLEGIDDKEVSPFHRAKEINIPVFLMATKDDARVPWRQADYMAKRLKKLKKDVVFTTVELGGHSMDNTEARAAFMAGMEEILLRTIGPGAGAPEAASASR